MSEQLPLDAEIIEPPGEPEVYRNGGRPKGSRNKFSSREFWALARSSRGLNIINGIMTRAEKLNEAGWTPNAEDVRCALFIASRLLHRAPVEIDVRHGLKAEGLLEALNSGDISAPELAALLNATGRANIAPDSAAEGSDARALLLERINRVVEDRRKKMAESIGSADPAEPARMSLAQPGIGQAAEAELAEDDDEIEKQIRELERQYEH